MDDQKQLFLFAHPIPGNDQLFIDRIRNATNNRNQHGAVPTAALSAIEASCISQMVVGPSHVAFLFKNGRVARLAFQFITESKEESSLGDEKSTPGGGGGGSSGLSAGAPGTGGGSGGTSSSTSCSASSSTVAALNRTAKIRRVMMAARRPGSLGERAGVIVDRTRPLVPANAIPEDLIAQAQVVLQGKSREVIVRELQRTNLNVNEAVNNLLSRDDEEGDDADDGSEAYLPEELLSLLDAGLRSDSHGGSVLDQDAFYAAGGEGFDYVVARDIARRRADREKRSDKPKEASVEASTQLKVEEKLQYWSNEEVVFPTGVTKFVKIVAMQSELIALGDNGFLYGWSWKNEGGGSMTAHPFGRKLLSDAPNDEKFIDIAGCSYRACVVTSKNRVGSFMDGGTCGSRVSDVLMTPLVDLPDGEKFAAIFACPMYSVVRTLSNNFYWWGIYPFNERRKLWERVRSRSRRHVTFDVSEISEGCEVRTKSHPIYPVGSIAVNFTSGTPMVGTLMEAAWTLSELCRFQVRTPNQYDEEKGEDGSCTLNSSAQKKSTLNQNGKRPRDEISSVNLREEPWALGEVIFIHEESSQDIGIVKIVDGAYCGIVYKQPSRTGNQLDVKPPTSSPEQAEDSAVVDLAKIRLMRKDELMIVSPQSKSVRSPENFQNSPQRIPLPGGLMMRRIYSVAADNTGLRLLVEKRGRIHLVRISVFGKLLSDHILPLNSSAVCGAQQGIPQLENSGEESVLIMRDGNGSVVPMVRDSMGGFREPAHLSLPPVHKLALGIGPFEAHGDNSKVTDNVTGSRSPVSRSAILAALLAPSPSSIHPAVPSLMQTILYCDSKCVELVLDALAKEPSQEIVKMQVLVCRSDGNRTILHAAVMNSFALTNKDEADTMDVSVELEKRVSNTTPDVDMAAADEVRATYEQRWQRMLRPRGGNAGDQLLIREFMLNPLRRPGHDLANVGDVLVDIARSFEDAKKPPFILEEIKDDLSMPILCTPVAEPKQRQLNSIEIVKTLCRHPTVSPFLLELLTTRDINGHTPFMCAVNVKAYTAAYVIWLALEQLQKEMSAGSRKQSVESLMSSVIFPSNSRPDDSPLFVLCVNDTCSFTWTGDEHINQDIFECKTCGLMGTLCCCTECAYTCHRNHDCKLKRTSPTAYCDCWEKCACKALVSGNTARREKLLEVLMRSTDLIKQVNSRGEHMMLFLARTVGRQLIEQEHYQRRSGSTKTKSLSSDNATPEHDLEPPKFARTAFMKFLSDWAAVKSLVMLGVKTPHNDTPILEDVFYLNQQNGASHLDKFVFTLLAKCSETHIDALLNTLIAESNKKNNGEEKRDPDVDFVIARFIRSVIRLFTLLTLLSPVAAGVAAAAAAGAIQTPAPSGGSSSRRSFGVHAISFSGLLSIVRSGSGRDNSAAREAKKKNVTNFVLKCRRIFQTMISYSINELCNMADALIAPVRLGIVKPTALAQQQSGSSNCLEMIEHHLYQEPDLSAMSIKTDDSNGSNNKAASKRRRHGSRRDMDRPAEDDSSASGGGTLGTLINVVDSDNSSDSESDDIHSSRRQRSQGSVIDLVESRDDEERQGRYHGTYDEEELFSFSGDEGDESIDSVSTPPDQDDEPTSQGNDANMDEDGGAEEGESDEDDERYEDAEDGDGNDEQEEGIGRDADERENEEEQDDGDGSFSEARSGDEVFVFRVRNRRRRGGGDEQQQQPTVEGENNIANNSAGNANAPEADQSAADRQVQVSRSSDTGETEHQSGTGNANTSANAAPNREDEEVGNIMEQTFDTDDYLSGSDSNANADSSARNAGRTRNSAEIVTRSSLTSHAAGVTSAPRNATFESDANRSTRTNSSGSARTQGFSMTSGRNNTLPITWAVRRASGTATRNRSQRHDSDDEGNNASDDNETFAEPSNSVRPKSRHLRDATSGEDDTHSSISKTNQQLAMSFSVITRLIVDLMPMLADHREYSKSSYTHIPKMLELSDAVVVAIRRLIEERLSVVWKWMETVLDRTEAQLRFGNALSATPAGASIVNRELKTSGKKSDDSSRKRDRPGSAAGFGRPDFAANAPPANSGRDSASKKSEEPMKISSSRGDLMKYVLSLMRSHANENGDDLPIIEFSALGALFFVADAYLSFVDMLEKIDSRIASGLNAAETAPEVGYIDMFQDEPMNEDGYTSPTNAAMRQFFQRSNSLLYPGITTAPNHHAFEHKCSESLALAERPQMLKPGVEKEQMFGLPIQQRTTSEHEKIAREHGAEHSAHQGLAAPWSSYKEMLPPSAVMKPGSREELEAATTSVRPNVIVYSKGVVSDTPATAAKARRHAFSSSESASAATSIVQPPRGFTPVHLETLMNALHQNNQSQLHRSLSRWKHTLNLMAEAYHNQLIAGCGGEASGSVLLAEMAGFSFRESQFRKKMEKFKATLSKDLVFEVERGKQELIAQTIRQLNMHFTRRTTNSSPANGSSQPSGSSSSGGGNGSASRENVNRSGMRLVTFGSFVGVGSQGSSSGDSSTPPLACHKVKVTFKDEPGEGTGVARSFYSAVADAFLTMQSLPGEQQVLSAFGSTASAESTPQSSGSRTWTRGATARERGAVLLGNLPLTGRRRTSRQDRRYTLSVHSQPYFSQQQPHLNESTGAGESNAGQQGTTAGSVDRLAPSVSWEPERETLGERLLVRVRAIRPQLCNKITGMLLDLQPHQLIAILASEDMLRSHVEEATEILTAAGLGNNSVPPQLPPVDHPDSPRSVSPLGKAASSPNLQTFSSPVLSGDDDLAPLFYRASKNGYFTPIAGKNTAHRLNAFRNVGRMMGICLLQMEIFPLHVCRHVFKFVLGRPINWFDLAFYDPALFESMRSLVYNEGPTRPDQITDLFLTFELNLPAEEGGGVVELKPGGSKIPVTPDNVVEYIYRFVDARLLGNHLKCLEAIKQGVYDVIPAGSLANLTAEDLRLLLCGTQEVSMTLMQSYTTFNDESSAAADVLQKFKGWFWSICNKFTAQEKQDLIFFWTGSPSLPSSEEGFQPMPTVLIRPADDQHLPTANTCISRLYLPLYSSKKLLRSKLQLAIKAKNFGFV